MALMFLGQNALSNNIEVRSLWLSKLEKIASPILDNMAKDSLSLKMPVYQHKEYQCLEAFGRTFCGISRWLDLKDNTEEDSIRECYRVLALKCIRNGFDPNASDHFNFSEGIQPLVDAAYLAQGLLRCQRVWNMLDKDIQECIIREFRGLRRVQPFGNNWLLFSSMIETFLYEKTGECDMDRLYNGVYSFIYGFYVGDGMYGDGVDFVFNYYNSFVIHPMLMDILLSLKKLNGDHFDEILRLETKRYGRYVQLLERQIMEDGSLPVYGRTVTCRLGILNAMAEFVCVADSVPRLSMGQIRMAMNAALLKNLSDNDFDENGFLKIGFQGQQYQLAEDYISSGSSYHCATFFLPLGLAPSHSFWMDQDKMWSSCEIYSSKDIASIDEAYIEPRTIENMVKRFYFRYHNLSEWYKYRIKVIVCFLSFILLVGFCTILYCFYFIVTYFFKRLFKR